MSRFIKAVALLILLALIILCVQNLLPLKSLYEYISSSSDDNHEDNIATEQNNDDEEIPASITFNVNHTFTTNALKVTYSDVIISPSPDQDNVVIWAITVNIEQISDPGTQPLAVSYSNFIACDPNKSVLNSEGSPFWMLAPGRKHSDTLRYLQWDSTQYLELTFEPPFYFDNKNSEEPVSYTFRKP